MKRRTVGWSLTIVAMAIAVFVAVDYWTGYDAIGAASRFLWNGSVFVWNSVVRLFGGVAATFARAFGVRRVARLTAAIAGVGLGYAGSVILSDAKLKRAHGWRGKLKAAITIARKKWHDLHLVWKLAFVAALIASQVYLHFLLIVFPIAFLVPVVRRAWILAADTLVGSWYWRKLGRWHDRVAATLRRMPVYRHGVAALRRTRLRYLCAWRMWRYDPRYRDPATGHHSVSLLEPVRLWWRGDLDRYVGRPLLAGPPSGTRAKAAPHAARPLRRRARK